MRVAVIRHHEEDSAGFIGAAFEARGAELSVCLFPKEGPLPALDDVDHIVVLGAVWSVYDDSPDRAWIADELAWLRQAEESGVPVLGICFGAQALAAAFGGRVEAAARKEIGWSVVDSYDPEVIPVGPWLEFHQDRFFPPPQARVLADNEVGVQAFVLGRHLAVQFHPEPDGELLRAVAGRRRARGGRAARGRRGPVPGADLRQESAARGRADALVASALLIAQQPAPGNAIP